jgi:glycosyltransferase involved in cell wall biosynthesis
VTMWYDLSGLVEWRTPHLGGIERTTAGVLAGLLAHGIKPRLVHVAPGGDDFIGIEFDDLPTAVREAVLGPGAPAPRPRMHVPVSVPAPPAAAPTAPTPRPTTRRRWLRHAIYGPGADGEAFRAAWHGFRASGRELLRQVGRRTGLARLRDGTTSLALPMPAPLEPEAAVVLPPPRIPFATGDVLVSCGGTFGMPGHPRAVDAARARGVRVARMVYDLIPATKPQWLAPRSTSIAWLRHVATRSDLVLAISDCTRRELEAYCRESGLGAPRTAVVRLGDLISTSADDLPPPLPRFVPRRPFFLCVSTIDVRKNHRCLYEAWSALAAERGDRCPDLICVGMPHIGVADLVHEIRHDQAVNRHLHLLHGIRDAELRWYYRHCVATIYPSKHEGWGLPVAESLAHGKVCLASSAASIREIDADLPEFFAPHDTARLMTLVERAVDDSEWRAGREQQIRRQFRPTAWTDTAAAVLAALDDRALAGEAA